MHIIFAKYIENNIYDQLSYLISCWYFTEYIYRRNGYNCCINRLDNDSSIEGTPSDEKSASRD